MLRKQKLRLFCGLVLLCATSWLPVYAQDAPTVVLIVRHAEKATDDPADPNLSEAGKKRAQDLLAVAAAAEVGAIYTTQYKRTQQTAQPLAAKLGLALNKVEITRENMPGYAVALAKEILAKHAGKTVLIVGHSNTVPQIAEAFGVARPAEIDEAAEYDRLLIVVVPKAGKARLLQARYGAGK